MKVAIAGGGKVGTYIASDLVRSGHEVVLIERDPARAAEVAATSKATIREADACELAELHAAGLDDADVMVAATGEDQVNLVVSLLAKQEFAIPRVVARVNHPKNQWLFNEAWGVDVSVSSPQLLTALVEEAVSVGSLVQLLPLRGSEAKLVEVRLAHDFPCGSVPLSQMAMPRDATIVAVVRDGHVIVPNGDTVFEISDEVLALVTPESEADLKALLVGR
ncbi:MAG TPA: TrkA family potassium uptake protein [Acidimicrobiales bacterium]|nr:TrkA family potassium uptake protein [Acidimicrobiales bacterium]